MQNTHVKEQRKRLMNVHVYENPYTEVKIKITLLPWLLNVCLAVSFQLFAIDKKITGMTCNLFAITKNTLNRSKCAFN